MQLFHNIFQMGYVKDKMRTLRLNKKIICLFPIFLLFIISFSVTSNVLGDKNNFVPKEDHVLLIVGQDIHTIDDYVKELGIIPGGFTIYTSIQEMDGIYSPADYGGGVQYANLLIEKYPNTVIQIGLYMVGALDGVIAGAYDANIDKLAKWIRLIKRPAYLRIGYEFDYPANSYDPEKYIRAYRYLVDKLKEHKVTNVVYVWHSYAGYVARPRMDWYPGDDYVDWFAISFFHLYNNQHRIDMAKEARNHNKPFMIAEASPAESPTVKGKESWDRWFRRCFDFIAEYDVKVFCYINCHWDELEMFIHQHWGNARIQENNFVKEAWINEISKRKYLQSSDDLFPQLGYTP